MYHYVLFDLDGTLTDPKEGICKSVQYALHQMHIEEPDLDKLECFIGPPLKTSYREYYGMDDAQCEEGVKKYRERYATIGIYENMVYPGMRDMLLALKQKGVHMAVASSKPKPFVDRILEHFRLKEFFEVVSGSDMSEKKVEKIDIMREALSLLLKVPEEKIVELPEDAAISAISDSTRKAAEDIGSEELKKKAKRILPVDDILMVGDRKFDILGAKHFFLDSAGVSYGYAKDGELEEAGATFITENLEDLYSFITEEKMPSKKPVKNGFQKSYHVLLPLVYDFALTYGILFLMQMLLNLAMNGFLKSKAGWFLEYASPVAVYMDAFGTFICAIVFYVLYKKEKILPISAIVERRINKRFYKDSFLIGGFGIAVALFLNLVFTYLQLVSASQTYQEVANVQYSVPMLYGLIIYGVIKPVEEELLFRGLIYGRMRQYYPLMFSVPVSALIFGACHGNLIQLLYGFVMGCILAVLFEKYRSIKANILFHSMANIAVYLFSVIPWLNKMLLGMTGFCTSGILTLLFLFILMKKWKKSL